MNPLREFWLRRKARRIGGDTMRMCDLPDGWYEDLRFFFGTLDSLVRDGQASPDFRLVWLRDKFCRLTVQANQRDYGDEVADAIDAAQRRVVGRCRVCGSLDVPEMVKVTWHIQVCQAHRDQREADNARVIIARLDMAEAERMRARGADCGLVRAIAEHRAWMAMISGVGSGHG